MKDQPLNVRAWYGLPAGIKVGRMWHWVKAGGVPLPHPGLVDLHLRRGIPHREGEQLTYWHELGHLETLPLALLHALALWLTGRRRKDTPRTLRLLIGVLAWLAPRSGRRGDSGKIAGAQLGASRSVKRSIIGHSGPAPLNMSSTITL